jgi:hypothetical protein
MGSRWLVAGCALLLAVGAGAQGGPTITLRDTGVIAVTDGQGKLATLELNVHGPEWTYASQNDATAQTQREEDGTRKFTGRLAVPNTTGGALTFLEEVDPREDGMRAGYELSFNQPMTVNGLQISLLLPADRFGGKMLSVQPAEGVATRILLPRILNPAKWQLGTVKGNKVEIQVEGENVFALATDKTSDFVIHDLRQWDRDQFEIRIQLFIEQNGKIVGTDERHSVAVDLAGLGAVSVTGP